MTERRPSRTMGGVHDQFWEHCDAHELRIQRCQRCAAFTWPPEQRCEECDSDQLRWEPVTGRGRLVSWATFHQRYYPELPVPWDTILVELDEGPLFISNPLGFTGEDMARGLEVEVRFIECEDDHGTFNLPVFAMAAAAGGPR